MRFGPRAAREHPLASVQSGRQLRCSEEIWPRWGHPRCRLSLSNRRSHNVAGLLCTCCTMTSRLRQALHRGQQRIGAALRAARGSVPPSALNGSAQKDAYQKDACDESDLATMALVKLARTLADISLCCVANLFSQSWCLPVSFLAPLIPRCDHPIIILHPFITLPDGWEASPPSCMHARKQNFITPSA